MFSSFNIFSGKIFASLLAVMILLGASVAVFADTIRLKDGSVIKGKVIDFKNGQFTIIRTLSNNRTTQITIYSEEVESIEFDNAVAPANASTNASPSVNNTANNNKEKENPIVVGNAGNTTTVPSPSPSPTPNNSSTASKTNTNQTSGGLTSVINSQPTSSNKQRPVSNGRFISFSVKVLADNTANGWTNSGLVVKKGQRIRISATGRISLGSGKYATPAGVGSIADGERLMKTEPTGALIAVIGDDNNDFIFIGSQSEFVAQRDGTLFLGVNEGNLDDNSGAFDAVVEAEAINTTAQK